MGISFLQPLLIPVAVAAILAFLLEPLVSFFIRLRLSRLLSILIVYIAATGLFVGLLVYILPPAYRQSTTLVKNFPQYLQKTEALSIQTINSLQRFAEIEFFREDRTIQTPSDQVSLLFSNAIKDAGAWIQLKIPDLAMESGKFLQRSVGGFLGVFGFLLSLILVPIFLFFSSRTARPLQITGAATCPSAPHRSKVKSSRLWSRSIPTSSAFFGVN